MNKDNIMGGAFIVARQIFKSKIWLDKPASWKIIWIYIIGNVCHKEQGGYKRGEGFFMFTKQINELGTDVTIDMVKKCLVFLRRMEMISTKRSTRGTRIKVLNFDKYQTLDNYSSTTLSTKKARRKHEESTPIYKKDKKDKKEKYSIVETSSTNLQKIPNLINDSQLHIQVIGLYARAKKINFENKEQQQAFIKRNLRSARNLVGYNFQQIANTMKYLIDNANFKWTLESVGKYIDEDLTNLDKGKMPIKL